MSIKIDIISGFLGAGKTTLIKKLFEAGFENEKVVLIENEYGEIGIDGSFLKEYGVDIKEINSGCICCSLVGDFSKSMEEIVTKFNPDRIIIEPSGVGKLSDIIKAVSTLNLDLSLNIVATVVDGGKCKLYMKNFGEFFNNQIMDAKSIIVSKVENLTETKLLETYDLLKGKNSKANIILASLPNVDARQLLEVLEKTVSMTDEMKEELEHEHHCCGGHGHECCGHHHEHEDVHECCGHHHEHEDGHKCCGHHHEHEDGHECCGHHHEHEDGHECCGHHHEHEDGHECCGHHHEHEDGHECCGHHHEHEDGHECSCGHHHEHSHDADEVFVSYGFETANSYSYEELVSILEALKNEEEYGIVLRSKGILRSSDKNDWYYFDYVAGDYQINLGKDDFMGRLVVIGSSLNKEKIEKLVLKK